MQRRQSLDPDDLDRPDWNSLKANYDKHDVGEAYLQGRLEQMGLHVEHWGIDKRHDDDALIFDNKMDLRLWEPKDDQPNPPDAADDFRGHEWREHTLDGDTRAYEMAMERDLEPSPQRIDEIAWELRGVCDVKTKANPDWLCALNLRHLAHYAEHADQYGCPVFLYFTLVNMDTESVGGRNIFVPVTTSWNYDIVQDHFDPDGQTMAWGTLKRVATDAQIVDRVSRAPDGNPVVWTDDDYWHESFDWLESVLLR